MIILITGKSGSGKTFIANKLASFFNAEVISFDKISHDALKLPDVINEIKTQFGEEIIENNVINRKKLGKIVFNDENKLQFLNSLIQTKMESQIDKILKNNSKIYILEYLLLPKMKYFNMSNCKVLIKANDHLRKSRIIERDNISEEYFYKRENNSIEFDENLFDIIVQNDNNLDFEKLASNIKEVLCSEKL